MGANKYEMKDIYLDIRLSLLTVTVAAHLVII